MTVAVNVKMQHVHLLANLTQFTLDLVKDTHTLDSHGIVPGKQNEWSVHKRDGHIT